jgi:hypothetical protein
MGWFTYYKLLKKYGGNIDNASSEELEYAAKCNPNNPPDALKLAQEKYEKYNEIKE